MSRLIIKGLPTRYDDRNLRDLFKPLGEVTDARVMKTKDGKSRCFGFVGFRTKQDAARARHTMNKAYVDTRPVVVEIAHAKGDESIPRAWSRYTAGSSKYNKIHGVNEENEYTGRGLRDNEDDGDSRSNIDRDQSKRNKKEQKDNLKDREFKEFEEVANQKKKNKVSDKSEMVQSKRIGSKGKIVERKHVTFEDDDDDDDDDLYEDLPSKEKEIESVQQDNVAEEQEAGDEVALNEAVSDMDYFKSKVVQKPDDAEGEEEEEEVSDEEEDDVAKGGSDDDDNTDEGSADEDSDQESEDNVDGDENANLKENKPESSPSHAEDSEDSDSSDVDELFRNTKQRKAENAELNKEKTKAKNSEAIDRTEPQKSSPDKKHEDVDAGETGRLLVRNLAFSVTEEDLETEFEKFGALSEVHIVRDPKTNKSRGMGFVQYCVPEQAAKALMTMDGSFQCGRILHVLAARPKPAKFNPPSFAVGNQGNSSGHGNDEYTEGDKEHGSSTFKSEREKQRKESAKLGKDSIAQHSLHLSADAVAQVTAERHGISKAELFGSARGESGVAAVRLAIAEASMQGEMKTYLRKHGIDLSVLETGIGLDKEINAKTKAAKQKRMSRLAFLVKNLPANTGRHELMDIFSKYGRMSKLLLVPSGVLGVVQFTTASDARRAFNGTAYSKFKDSPLYLEWLPKEAITDPAPDAEENPQGNGVQYHVEGQAEDNKKQASKSADKSGKKNADTNTADKVTTGNNKQKTADNDEDKEEVEELHGCSVYVKNLSFETRDKAFRAHFETVLRRRRDVLHGLRSAKVALKRGPEGKESERLSMGFGFVEFSTPGAAREAVKLAQGSTLDGHALRLQLSAKQGSGGEQAKKRKHKDESSSRTAKVKPSSKLIVRNVSFEASKRDVRQLFETFGQLKVVRMPHKLDGAHRGFAFVEFVSTAEAAAAYDALAQAHLYGRHLVIEYAKTEAEGAESIAELERRAAFDAAQNKRRKVFDGPTRQRENVADEKDGEAMMKDELYG